MSNNLIHTPHGRIRSIPIYDPEQLIDAPNFDQDDAIAYEDQDHYAPETEDLPDDKLIYDQNGRAYMLVSVDPHTIQADELATSPDEISPQFYVDDVMTAESRYEYDDIDNREDGQRYNDEAYYDEALQPTPGESNVEKRMFMLLLGVFAIALPAVWVVYNFLMVENVRLGATADLSANASAGINTLMQGEPQVAGVQQAVPATTSGRLSPIFMPTVHHWEWLIVQAADERGLDPDMLATIMQIESCGDPQAQSWAGAMGLFQVMPFHFTADEDMLDPLTNAKRGANYFAERMVQTGNNPYLSFAGYNGGHVAAASGWDNWAAETRRYYTWGKGIYDEAKAGTGVSLTLQEWLAAGGNSLCNQAATRLGY